MTDVAVYQAWENPKDSAVFTPFTFAHFVSGIVAYVIIFYLFPNISTDDAFFLWFLLHSVYEFKDMFKQYTSNSIPNSFGDTIGALAGFVIASVGFKKPISLRQALIVTVLYIVLYNILHEPGFG